MRTTTTGPLRVLDTTLREGEQFAQAHFTTEDRLRLALALDAFGVDEIELPSPAVSPAAAEDVAAVLRLGLRAAVRVHLRCTPADVEAALACGARGVNLFLGASPALGAHSLRETPRARRDRVRAAVGLAAQAGAFVRFSAEDAFRTPRRDLLRLFDVEAGARRLGVPDTVGTATPEAVAATVGALRRRYPGIGQEFHGHNDTGCAIANAIAAWQAGAECLDVTVLGLGERVGITSLGGLMARLYTFDPGLVARYRLEQLPALDAAVAALVGVAVPFNQPLTAAHAFTHVAGVHSNAVLRAPHTYEAVDPAVLGRTRVVSVTSRLTGRHAVARFATELLGRPVDAEEARGATAALKATAERRRIDVGTAADIVRAALGVAGEA